MGLMNLGPCFHHLRKMKRSSALKSDPFFIVGSGRSGSTLLRMILSSHSRIFIPPETWYILPLVEEIPLTSPLNSREVKKATDIIISHYRWVDIPMTDKEFLQAVEKSGSLTLRGLLDLIYGHCVSLYQKQRWGDKTPVYIKILPQLSVLYPEAKFIYLLRDGHDVAKSFYDVGWYSPFISESVIEWKEAASLYIRHKTSSLADKILEIRYEDFVRNMEKEVKSICRFLNEEYQPSMLQWQSNIKDYIPSREAHIHKKLYRQPQEDDAFRWKREMSKRHVLIIESHIHGELTGIGYYLKYKDAFWRPLFFLVRLICRILVAMRRFASIFRRAVSVQFR